MARRTWPTSTPDLVKVVDGDATLYTYKFLFNTKTNVGEFADGAW